MMFLVSSSGGGCEVEWMLWTNEWFSEKVFLIEVWDYRGLNTYTLLYCYSWLRRYSTGVLVTAQCLAYMVDLIRSLASQLDNKIQVTLPGLVLYHCRNRNSFLRKIYILLNVF